METIKIFVVEDDFIQQQNLFILLEELGHDLVGFADNYKDAISKILATRPDLVLMDIRITGEKDGIATAEKINQLHPVPIIYITSLTDSETIQNASATRPFAYLTKPIERPNLEAAIKLAMAHYTAKETSKTKDNSSFEKPIFLKQANSYVRVFRSQIFWVEVAKDHYCLVNTTDNEFLIRSTIKEMGQKLSAPEFLRIHRSYIVQVAAITEFDDFESVVTVNGKQLPVGRTYKKKLMELFEKW